MGSEGDELEGDKGEFRIKQKKWPKRDRMMAVMGDDDSQGRGWFSTITHQRNNVIAALSWGNLLEKPTLSLHVTVGGSGGHTLNLNIILASVSILKYSQEPVASS